MILLKISGKTVLVSFALKPDRSAIYSRIFPGFIRTVNIISGSFSPHPRKSEKHTLDKGMDRCFATFVLTVKDIDPRRKLQCPVMDFSKISDIQSSDNHILPVTCSSPAKPEVHNIMLFLPLHSCLFPENN